MRAIAVIGLGCRFPGADGAEAFWRLLSEGRCAVGDLPPDRWDANAFPAPRAGFIDRPDQFDAAFFGISETEAPWIDPQQRLLLECAHWAVEHAGVPRHRLRGSRAGVYVGISGSEYGRRFGPDSVGPFGGTGSSSAIAANRISYLFDLHGPSLSIDTACSSSLMAVLTACRALAAGECDLALAGGVSLMMAPEAVVCLSSAGMLAADGLCKSFDAAADGYGRGEGAGMVVLRRLDDALVAGDRVLAVIRGGATNQDGLSNGLTAPNPAAQEALLAEACADAGVRPGDVDYVEAHGTGTLLGDPIEAKALGRVMGQGRAAGRPLSIGTVKTNIGHLEAAAGIAGLTKLVLALAHGQLPPSLHFTNPNPHIPFDRLGLRVQTELEDWPATGRPPLAGISSFGFGGSNVHLVVEGPPAAAMAPDDDRRWRPLVLSARTADALQAQAAAWADRLAGSSNPMSDICATATVRRSPMPSRMAVVARDPAEAAERLRAGPAAVGKAPRKAPAIAFLFSGQGSQYAGMARRLYDLDPAFRAHLDHCASVLDLPLLDVLFGTDDALLAETRHAQPALFAVGSGLCLWWCRHGVEPAAVGGHSLGDYLAAWAAGALTLEDGLRLVAERGRLMHALAERGTMAVALAPAERVEPIVTGMVEIAGYNGPAATTLSGPVDAVVAAVAALAAEGVTVRRLDVGCAFHSHLLDPMLADLEREAARAASEPLVLPMACNLTGTLLPPGTVLSPKYWREHSRQPVRFAESVAALGANRFLEIGPHPVLAPLVAAILPEAVVVPSLRRGRDDDEMLADAQGRLFVAGVPVRWEGVDRPLVDLPLTSFERKSFLLGASEPPAAPVCAPVPVRAIGAALPRVRAIGAALPRVRAMVAELVGVSPDAIDVEQPFLEMGADSLVLVSAIGRIERDFGVKLAVRQLFDQLPTVADLARHLDDNSAPVVAVTPAASLAAKPAAVHSTTLEPRPTRAVLPPSGVAEKSMRALTPEQRRHLDALTARYTARTAKSKEFAQRHRPVLADSRASAGFRFTTKEMLYPIVGARAEGARFWDLDGNSYLDVTMGFGVHLFGHEPPFIKQALARRLDLGMPLGPQAEEAGEAAEIIARLTGLDRVCFCNSGTEAVMSAIRLARTATGRNRIALFAGSYHGHAEGTLAEAGHDSPFGQPMVPGVSPGAVGDVLVLDYGDPRSLELVEHYGPELAAVLVEPVQSRRPDLQPVEFLRELRRVTEAAGTLLVFDEMITGFRVHPGGAQAVFGIKADLATYGKVVGGGMPIGVVAGRADVMDAVDGGQWAYGDDSYPAAETTLFAGTFNKHPLTMAATVAVLREIEARGPALQEGINARTAALTDRLNRFFAEVEAPVSVARFGSLFRFGFRENLDLLFYHLLEQGIYVWEGRNCFLSAAHDDADVETIAKAVETGVLEMADGGFLPRVRLPRHAVAAPLSPAQNQLAVLSRLSAEASAAYGVSLVLDVQASLDPVRLERAVALLGRRHEALATAVDAEAGAQRVDPAAVLRLEVTSDPRAIEEFVRRPFNLAEAPLLRVLLVQDAEGDRLALVGHHIMVDGLSMQLLARDLSALYADAGLPPAPTFRRILSRLEAQRGGTAWAAARAYWLNQFQTFPPPLDLPGDRPRPPARSWRGGRVTHALPDDLGGRLQAAAARARATPFMVLMAAFAALLHRVSGAEDLVVGVPYAGRDVEGGETVVGYCTHLLPVRLAVAGDEPVASLVTRCRDRLLDAFDHASFQLAELIDALKVPRSPGRSPLVEVVFNVDRVEGGLDFAGHAATMGAAPVAHAKFDLGVNVTEAEGRWWVEADYNGDILDATSVERLLAAFERVVDGVCANPEVTVAALALASDDEMRRLSVEFNDTARDFGRPVGFHHRVLAAAKRTPDAVAVTGWTVAADAPPQRIDLTYAELSRRALALAAALKSAGVESEDRVALVVPRGPDMVAGLVGVLAAGAAYVPMDPDLPPARLVQLYAGAGCSAAVAAGDMDLPVIRIDRLGAATTAPAEVTPESPAYVLFTSGSTGQPKPVLLPHGAVTNYTDAIVERLGLDDGLTYAMVSTFMADLGNTCLLPALATGGRLLVVPAEAARDPALLAACLGDIRADVLKIVPTHLRALLSAPGGEAVLPARILVMGGERCPPALAERLAELRPGLSLWNHYGPTEACVGVLAAPVSPGDPGALGRPLANCRVHVLDAGLRPVPTGVPGEVWIGGACLATGYLNQPDRTAEAFRETAFGRLYRTGDRARFRADGQLELMGRIDDQAKIRGFRVEPGEVAATLSQWPAVAQAEVVVRTESGAAMLVAYVVPALGAAVDSAGARAFLAERLPEHMIPQSVVVMDALPATANGKIDRAALPAPVTAAATDAGPASEAEARLLACWRQVLGRDDIGLDDDFFALGGDSIMSIQVAARLHRDGLGLNAGDVYRYPTIRLLAPRLSAKAGDAAEQGRLDGPVPLLPIQHRFFEDDRANPHHWTMSVLLDLDPGVTAGRLQAALDQLLRHHDALRLVFARTAEGWTASFGDAVKVPLVESDLSLLGDGWREVAVGLHDQVQASLDLGRGPMIAAHLLHRPEGLPPQLLLVVHHLAMDGISWRILLGDLAALLQGEADPLGDKTASVRQWAQRLADLAAFPDLDEDAEYWQLSAELPPSPLPRRAIAAPGAVDSVTVAMDATATDTLLRDCHRVAIDDVLLTALVLALAEWTGEDALLIDLEGHGREPLDPPVDLSRTIGWFSTRFPVWLGLEGEGPEGALAVVSEQRRAVPRNGLGFGMLRYLRGDAVLAQAPRPEISFNYLGRFDESPVASAPFHISGDPRGCERDPAGPRRHLLAVDAMIIGGRLNFDWQFDPRYHDEGEIEALARRTVDNLADQLSRGIRRAEGTAIDPRLAARLTEALAIDIEPAK